MCECGREEMEDRDEEWHRGRGGMEKWWWWWWEGAGEGMGGVKCVLCVREQE